MTAAPENGVTVGEAAWRAALCAGSRGWDHEWRGGTVGPDTRVAAVMHVTSMRPSRNKFGMGLASRRGSPTSFSTAAIYLVFFFIFPSPLMLL